MAALLDSAEQRIFDIRRGKNMQGLQRINELVIEDLRPPLICSIPPKASSTKASPPASACLMRPSPASTVPTLSCSPPVPAWARPALRSTLPATSACTRAAGWPSSLWR